MTQQTITTFKGLPVLKQSAADRVSLPDILISHDMEEYSGWGWLDHIKWVSELTGLDLVKLVVLPQSYVIATDESCSEVWLLSSDYYKSTARLIYSEDTDED